MGLIILEWGLLAEGALLMKQALTYPIEIIALLVTSPSMVEGSPPPPLVDGSQHHDCRFRRQDSRPSKSAPNLAVGDGHA
jgi:hypothetical protein